MKKKLRMWKQAFDCFLLKTYTDTGKSNPPEKPSRDFTELVKTEKN